MPPQFPIRYLTSFKKYPAMMLSRSVALGCIPQEVTALAVFSIIKKATIKAASGFIGILKSKVPKPAEATTAPALK